MSRRLGLPKILDFRTRATSPAIIPIVLPRTGNNKPKSLQKTKRTFSPNITKVDWTLNVLGGVKSVDDTSELPKLKKMKMQVRRLKDVEKAGGIEGYLLSRRPKDLTPYGVYLRSELFDTLHRIKSDIQQNARLQKEMERANLLGSGADPLNVKQRIGEEGVGGAPLLEGQ